MLHGLLFLLVNDYMSFGLTPNSFKYDSRPDIHHHYKDEEEKGGKHDCTLVHGYRKHLSIVVGDECRDRVASIKKRVGYDDEVAADHQYCDCLTHRTAQGQYDSRHHSWC